jgi:HPt (histidine-containing phosphotransfer) domain-containing protein
MDAEIVEILIPAVLDHCPHEMAALRSAIDSQNVGEALRLSHSLKGTFAALGAEPAQRRAGEIEAAAKAGNMVGLEALHDDLETQYARLSAVLRERIPQ